MSLLQTNVVQACTCGTGCHYLFMWDATDGRFYPQLPPGPIVVGPFEVGQSSQKQLEGEQYRVDSELLIVEGCREQAGECGTWFYRWNGRTFRLLRKNRFRPPVSWR